MAKRRSIYLSTENDEGLQTRFADQQSMHTDGQLNYTKAVNAALQQWLASSPEIGDRPYADLVMEMTAGNIPEWMNPLSYRTIFSLLRHGITEQQQLQTFYNNNTLHQIPNLGKAEIAQINKLMQS